MLQKPLLSSLLFVLFTSACASSSSEPAVASNESALDQALPRATLEFRADGQNVQRGVIVAGGKLTIDYELSRLAQCFGSTYQGSPAWSTSTYARFSPGGQTVTGLVTQPVYEPGVGTRIAKRTVDLDVPSGATGLELWFATGGVSCETHWDSDFGKNFRFSVASDAPAVSWAGSWGSLISRGCMPGDRLPSVPEPLVYDSWIAQRATCRFIEADVYVPGITDGADVRPELVLAEVEHQRDGGRAERASLAFVGRVGNNYRFRWDLDRSGIDFQHDRWNRIDYGFRFSTDGAHWYRVAQADGPDGGVPRSIVRPAP